MRWLSKRKHESKPFNWIETRFSLNLFAGWLVGWTAMEWFFSAQYFMLRFDVRAAMVHTYTWIRVYIGIELGLITIVFAFAFIGISRNLSLEWYDIAQHRHKHEEDCNNTLLAFFVNSTRQFRQFNMKMLRFCCVFCIHFHSIWYETV